MSGSEAESIGTPLECFWEACDTDMLSLQFVRESIASLPKVSDVEFVDYSLLHRICANERVSLEIVEEILRFYPDAVKITETEDYGYGGERGELSTSYPLHAACENGNCPLSVIKLLVQMYPAALRHVGQFGCGLRTDERYTLREVGGTPLSYYLDRRINLTLEGVKFLVEACPEALKMSDKEAFFMPLHTLAINPTLSEHFDVLQYLIRSEPSLLGMERDDEEHRAGDLPLRLACRINCGVSLEIVKFLVETLLNERGEESWESPLLCICQNKELDDSTAIEILKYLVQEDPGGVRERSNGMERLPLHCAAGEGHRNRAFCGYLIDQFPESLRIGDTNGELPLHQACTANSLDVVKCIYEACPDALGVRTYRGFLPVHDVIFNGHQRSEIIDFLLSVDPDALSKRVVGEHGYRFDGNLPLHVLADLQQCPDPVAGGKFLFDTFPEALLAKNDLGLTPVDLAVENSHSDHDRRKSRLDLPPFLEAQHQYALKAERIDELTTLDEEGRLLLHRAILDKKASLGALKLLVKGNLNSVRVRDNNGMLPAQLACQHSSPDIVQYFLEQEESALGVCDSKGDNLLHLACRSRNSGTAKCILEKCPSLASSENSDGLLPLHLLCDKSGKDDGVLESVEYTEAIWRLLLAEPATLLSAVNDVGKSINGKRKRGSEESV